MPLGLAAALLSPVLPGIFALAARFRFRRSRHVAPRDLSAPVMHHQWPRSESLFCRLANITGSRARPRAISAVAETAAPSRPLPLRITSSLHDGGRGRISTVRRHWCMGLVVACGSSVPVNRRAPQAHRARDVGRPRRTPRSLTKKQSSRSHTRPHERATRVVAWHCRAERQPWRPDQPDLARIRAVGLNSGLCQPISEIRSGITNRPPIAGCSFS
jgi:hypothetical protein